MKVKSGATISLILSKSTKGQPSLMFPSDGGIPINSTYAFTVEGFGIYLEQKLVTEVLLYHPS